MVELVCVLVIEIARMASVLEARGVLKSEMKLL